jgi:nicotinamide mononucleotide transporter
VLSLLLAGSWSWGQLFNSPIEIFAVITGVICVALITFEYKNRRLAWWNWPIGALSSAAFAYVFWDYGLIFNAALQLFYVGAAFYGGWAWKHGGENRTELLVTRAKPGKFVLLTAGIFIAALGLSTSFDLFGVQSSAPFWDALVVTFSLAAQFIMTRKIFEHWTYWIAVDIIGVFLFWSQGLFLTSVLYFVYGSLCVRGLFTWWKAYKSHKAVPMTTDPLMPTPIPLEVE